MVLSVSSLLLFVSFIGVIAGLPQAGISIQFQMINTPKNQSGCAIFPVAYDWWAGASFPGNNAVSTVNRCSAYDLTAIDQKHGQSFLYSHGADGQSFVYVFNHRAPGINGEVVTTPRMVSMISTPQLTEPNAMVYDEINDTLIILDSSNYTLYYLDYLTGELQFAAVCNQCFQMNCQYSVLSGNNFFCVWETVMYGFNLISQQTTMYDLPLSPNATTFENVVGMNNVEEDPLVYFIYYNPDELEWNNFLTNFTATPIGYMMTVRYMDSEERIFGGSSTDLMKAIHVYSANGQTLMPMIRGPTQFGGELYMALWKMDDALGFTLLTNSKVIETPLVPGVFETQPMMWDGTTLSSITQ